MSQIAQQVITPTFVDDGSVMETFANGPVSVSIQGQFAIVIFTVVRGDFEQSMSSRQVSKMTARPASRMVLPLQVFLQTRDLMNQVVVEPSALPAAKPSTLNRTQ